MTCEGCDSSCPRAPPPAATRAHRVDRATDLQLLRRCRGRTGHDPRRRRRRAGLMGARYPVLRGRVAEIADGTKVIHVRTASMGNQYLNYPANLSARSPPTATSRPPTPAELTDGLLRLRGRTNQRLNIAGRKFGADSIRSAVLEFPGAARLPRHASDDPSRRDCVGAVIESRAALDITALREHLRGRIAEFKVPEVVLTTDCLPAAPRGNHARLTSRRCWPKPLPHRPRRTHDSTAAQRRADDDDRRDGCHRHRRHHRRRRRCDGDLCRRRDDVAVVPAARRRHRIACGERSTWRTTWNACAPSSHRRLPHRVRRPVTITATTTRVDGVAISRSHRPPQLAPCASVWPTIDLDDRPATVRPECRPVGGAASRRGHRHQRRGCGRHLDRDVADAGPTAGLLRVQPR